MSPPAQSDVHLNPDAPWYATFPTPQSAPPRLEPDYLHGLIREHGPSSNEFLVVDVRRTDFERAFIRGAINLPAHSFFPTLPSLLPLLRTYKRVIFHCQSSSGRGPRCAGWLQDALDALPESDKGARPDVVVLKGGVKEWYRLYAEDEGVTVKIAGEGWSD